MSTDLKKELLKDWKKRCHVAQSGHYFTSSVRMLLHYAIGILLIIATAVLSAIQAGLLESLGISSANCIDFIKVVLTLISAILANIQIFFDFSGKAASHQIYAGEYGRLKRDIENLDMEIDKVAENWNKIAIGAPITPKRFINKAKKEVEKQDKKE